MIDIIITTDLHARTSIGTAKADGTPITIRDLLDAFMDMMDGVQDHDIASHTGVSDDRAAEIASIRKALLADWVKRINTPHA